MKTEMLNAVFFMREQVHENLEMESEKRCFSIITDMRYGTTINSYPITEEDLMDCNGEVPEQFEESLDDHEKLLDLLSESNTLCSVHSAQVNVQRFRDIRDEGLQGVHKAHAPIAKFRNALNDEELEDKLGFRCAECAKCLTCKTSSRRTAISLREAREQQFIEESVSKLSVLKGSCGIFVGST